MGTMDVGVDTKVTVLLLDREMGREALSRAVPGCAGLTSTACRRMEAVDWMAAVRTTLTLATPLPGVGSVTLPAPYDTPASLSTLTCTRTLPLPVVTLEV